jgi:hypothetical protein
MSTLLGRGYGLGLHRYDPSKYIGAVFLDVSDAQYNPLDPEEIVASINSAEKPGYYGLAKFRNGRVVANVLTPYRWGGFEFYIDPEEERIYLASGENVIEIRDLNSLGLVKKINVPVNGVVSVALDSRDRIWFITNRFYGGDNSLYMIDEDNSIVRIKEYSLPASIDSMRISPWGRKILVADYGRHTVECISEDGEATGILYFPYVSGVKWSIDERVVLSSGKYPKHVFLLLITGALHNTIRSGWYGYIMDYGVQASNRADMYYLDRILIQWYLGFHEHKLPLPKNKPYVIRIGSGTYKGNELVKEEGFIGFTPIIVFNKCTIFSNPSNIELVLEKITPHYSIIAPKPKQSWEIIDSFKGKYTINIPGIYRLRTINKTILKDTYAVCQP